MGDIHIDAFEHMQRFASKLIILAKIANVKRYVARLSVD
jgi:hypothetical protein